MRSEELAAEFDGQRPRLVRIAYAILGSRSEAEDVVADTWLRLVESDAREPVRDVAGWATVVVSRAAIDVLRSARIRREAYVGPWLPEPEVQAPDPADRVTLDDTVRYALLVVLEQLSPAERTAWVLHDLFDMPFDQVAQAVGRSPAAVRQLASRARRRVAAQAPRVDVDRETHERVVTAFLGAAAGGDLARLVALLDPGVVLTSDGGGVVNAARRPVVGPDRVARFMLGVSRKKPDDLYLPVMVNGRLGLVGLAATRDGDRAGSTPDQAVPGQAHAPVGMSRRVVMSFTTDAGLITRIDIVMAPDKLGS